MLNVQSREFLCNFGNFKINFREFLVNTCGNPVCVLPQVTMAPTEGFFHPDLFFSEFVCLGYWEKSREICVFEVMNSSVGQVFANFATFFYSFQQLPKYSKYMQFNVLSCFQDFYIATFCNIFDFCVQLLTAIFIKYCAKCKSVIKKNTKLFQFSSILLECMKKGYMTD